MKNIFAPNQKQEALQGNLQGNLQSNQTENLTENQKQDTLTDKAFSQSLTISIFSILLCIVLLCSLTFAWFNQDVSSPSNTLEAGQFVVDIVVTDDASKAEVVGTEKDGVWTYALDGVGTYTVTVTASDQATAKGYCEVTLNGGEILSTVHLIGENYKGTVMGEITRSITFTVKHEGTTPGSLVIAPHWGIPSNSTVQTGSVLPPDSVENVSE
ncbi:MAG: hypothetical protein IJW70_04640 [Clostridia bacterium]|nr:hypothetical protein [Clostridia bacterium]